MSESRIYTHWGFTLVDITNTGVTSFTPEKSKQRDQQRNWETVLQILGLKSQVLRIEQGVIEPQRIDAIRFGSAHQRELGFTYPMWVFEFDVEFDDIYKLENDPYGRLKQDFDKVPIITGLDETYNAPLPIFYTEGEYKNIVFMRKRN